MDLQKAISFTGYAAHLPVVTGKTGWPWKSETIESHISDSREWPRISIVTPSYMQGKFIEQTIRSVLLQGYPNLEYIVIDGGSTDGTLEIIKKYEPWISFWVSEKDRGQSDAINKGFMRAGGELGNWLNSDDLLTPGALFQLAKAYLDDPNALICGDVVNFCERDGIEDQYIAQTGIDFENVLCYWRRISRWHQPGLYFPVEAFKDAGGLDVSLEYSMDYDLFCRILQKCGVRYLKTPIVKFRTHDQAKSTVFDDLFWVEKGRVFKRYSHLLYPKILKDEFPEAFSGICLVRSVRRLKSGDVTAAIKIFLQGLSLTPAATLKAYMRHLINNIFKRFKG